MMRAVELPAISPEVGLSPAAAAAGLEPRQAGTVELDGWTASVRYTVDGHACRVVTIITPSREAEGGPLRFAVTLAPGQKHSVTVARLQPNATPAILDITCTDGALSVEPIRPPAWMVA